MKLLTVSILLGLLMATSSIAQSDSRNGPRSAADLTVTDLEIDGGNINQVLAKIAYKYSVPISLEVAIDDDLLKSAHVSVHVKRGKIADVLDNIVKQKPSYTWEFGPSTIRVFPKNEFRDPLLQTLLALRIDRFVLPKRTARLTFRQTLTQRPELKNLLASYHVSPSNEAFSQYDIASFGGDFSLDLENESVQSILDNVISNSQTKYWFIKREGEKREYLLINF